MKKRTSKRIILASLAMLLSSTALSSGVHALDPATNVRAVRWNGLTVARKPAGLGGPLTAQGAVCSLWYKSNLQQTAPWVQVASTLNVAQFQLGVNTTYTGVPRLAIFAANFTGSQTLFFLSASALPIGDDIWHHVLVIVDTALGLATYSLDINNPQPEWSTTYSIDGRGGQPLLMAINGSNWSIAGDYISNAFWYVGDMAELFCDFFTDNADLYTLASAARIGGGFAALNLSTGVFHPLELGPNCTAPFRREPVLCLRGNELNFLNNKGRGPSQFTVLGYSAGGGILQRASSDPFFLVP